MHRLIWSVGILTGWSAVLASTPAVMDVVPGSPEGYINTLERFSAVPVAVLTTSLADGDPVEFNAGDIDASSVRFGPQRTSHDPNHGLVQRDVDNDGDIDAEMLFHVPESGISCGDESVYLSGSTVQGDVFYSWGRISTPDCPECHAEPGVQRSADTDSEFFFVAEDSTLHVARPADNGFTGLVGQVQHGQLNIDPDGSFGYLPGQDYFGMGQLHLRGSFGG